jgi:hypothetical protein
VLINPFLDDLFRLGGHGTIYFDWSSADFIAVDVTTRAELVVCPHSFINDSRGKYQTV